MVMVTDYDGTHAAPVNQFTEQGSDFWDVCGSVFCYSYLLILV